MGWVPTLFFLLFLCSDVQAGVVLKVREVNPLDKIVTELVRYPLPVGVKPEDVKDFKIEGYYHEVSLEETAGEGSQPSLEETHKPSAPPKYRISFDKEKKVFVIEVEVTFPPKGVVSLEIGIEEVWFVAESKIEALRDSVPELPEGGQTGISLRGMIFKQLDEIIEKQGKSSVAQVGVEEHIKAYEKNIEILEQVEFDNGMLKGLITEEQKKSKDLSKKGSYFCLNPKDK